MVAAFVFAYRWQGQPELGLAPRYSSISGGGTWLVFFKPSQSRMAVDLRACTGVAQLIERIGSGGPQCAERLLLPFRLELSVSY
jgi:hypothetical protein